jgi:hypothetical protein
MARSDPREGNGHRRSCGTVGDAAPPSLSHGQHAGKLDQFELSDIVRNLVSRRPAGVAAWSFERRERITMRNNARAAAAIGIGYMMGRNRKFRGALVLAAATAVGGTPISRRLLKRGMGMAASPDMLGKVSPQFGDIADTLRNDLLTAGKAAASAAFSNRVDSLADSIHERAERFRNPVDMLSTDADESDDEESEASDGATRAADGATRVAGRATRVAGRATRAAGRATRAADEDADEPGDMDEPDDTDEPGEDDGEPRGEIDEDDIPLQRTGPRRRSPVTRAQDSQTQGSQKQSSRARSSQTQGSQTRSTRSRAGRTGR